MYRLASSLIASATLVFVATGMLGTALANGHGLNPPPHIVQSQPKVIATVVAHGHLHNGSLTVHGL